MNHRRILIAGGVVVVLGLCGIVAHGIYADWRDRRDALAETLTPVIGRAFADGARIVHLGDTRHARSDPLMRWLASPEIMQRLHVQGVTMLCLESPALMQRFADGVVAGRLSRAQYADSLIACGYATTSGNARERFCDEAAIIRAAARAGLRVSLVDFENGKEESRAYYRALQKARINSGYEDFGPDGEWQARYPHLSQDQQREIDALRAAFIKARHNDARLTDALTKISAPGEKILLVYGAAHGAGPHDLNELLAVHGVPLVRINIHADRKAFDDYSAIPTEPPQGSYILAEHLFIPAGGTR